MLKSSQICGLAAGLAILAGTSSRLAAAEPTAVQQDAQTRVRNAAKVLTKTAYVTSKSHTLTEFVDGNNTGNGTFDLTYRFHYRDSDNDPQSYTLTFYYDKAGQVAKTGIGPYTSFWPPFNFIGGVAAAAEALK